jgi:hypothetical protein
MPERGLLNSDTLSRHAATCAAVMLACVSAGHAQTVIDMPPPPPPPATTDASLQAEEGTAEPVESDEPAADASALDAYAFGRQRPRVLRAFSAPSMPGVASTFPGPINVSIAPSTRWGSRWSPGLGCGWGWNWGWNWGWSWGWNWGGWGPGAGHGTSGSAVPAFSPSSFRFTPGQ